MRVPLRPCSEKSIARFIGTLPRIVASAMVVVLASALVLTSCQEKTVRGTPVRPRAANTSVPVEVTATPEPTGPSLLGFLPLRQGIGPNPTDLWLDEMHGRLYVLCTAEMDIVDTATDRVTRVPLPSDAQILAVDADRERVLLGGSGGNGPAALFVADGVTGATLQKVDLPATPWRTLFLADRNLAITALTPGQAAAVNMDNGQYALLAAGGARPILAADPAAGKAYLSGGVSSSGAQVENALSVVDLKSGEVTLVPLYAKPTAFGVDEASHSLFILHQYAGTTTIYAPTFNLQRTVPVGGEPTEIATVSDPSSAYIVDWTGGRVVALNDRSATPLAVAPVPAGSHVLGADAAARVLFLGRSGDSQVSRVRDTGTTEVELPGAPEAMTIHPGTGVAYMSIPTGRLLVALAPNGEIVQRWMLPGTPLALALNAEAGRLYVSLPDADALAVLDLVTGTQRMISHALAPSAAVLNPADGLLYLADVRGAALYAYSLDQELLARTVSVGPGPSALTMNRATGELLAACSDGLYAVAPGEPSGKRILQATAPPLIAVNANLNRIYAGMVGTQSGLRVLDGATHNVLKTLEVSGKLFYLSSDDRTGRLLAMSRPSESAQDLTLALIDGQTLEERLVNVPLSVPRDAKLVAKWDPVRGKLSLAIGGPGGRLVLVNTSSGEVRSVAQFGQEEGLGTQELDFSLQSDSALGKAYLGCADEKALIVVDNQSVVSTTLQLEAGVTALAVDTARSRVYAALTNGILEILDGRSLQAIGRVPLGSPVGLLLADSAGERVFTVDETASTVGVIRDPSVTTEAKPTPTPAPSPTIRAPISPWTTFADGDAVRVIQTDGTYVWVGTAAGGVVRWDADGGGFRQFLAPQDGLRSNEVNALVVQGKQVWAATSRGLSRFDGSSWTTYLSDESGLPGNVVRAAAMDQSGRVWVGVQEGAVSVFDGRNWIGFTPDRLGLEGTWTTEIASDAEGRLWFGSWLGVTALSTSGVTIYTPQNSELPAGVVGALLVANDGSIWVGTDTGVAVFRSGTWNAFLAESGAPDHVWALAETAEGTVWAAADSGVYRFDGEAWSNVGTVREAAEAYALQWADIIARTQKWPIVFAGGRVWAALSSGLADFDGLVWTRHSTAGATAPISQVRALGLGADGRVWAGLSGAGVVQFANQGWQALAGPEQTGTNVNAILADTERRTWFASDEGVSVYDGQRWTFYKSGELGLLGGRALGLAWDPAGTLWVATEQGVSAWRRGVWTSYPATGSELSGSRVLALAVDTDGSLWCATSGGVARYDGQAWTLFTKPDAPATEQEISALALGADGYRWFAARQTVRRLAGTSWFDYQGLREAVEYDYTRILKTLNNPNGLWAVDAQHGKVWTITEDGVAAYNGRTWETYTPENSGLVSSDVRAIVVDAQGAVWFATDKGISRLSP